MMFFTINLDNIAGYLHCTFYVLREHQTTKMKVWMNKNIETADVRGCNLIEIDIQPKDDKFINHFSGPDVVQYLCVINSLAILHETLSETSSTTSLTKQLSFQMTSVSGGENLKFRINKWNSDTSISCERNEFIDMLFIHKTTRLMKRKLTRAASAMIFLPKTTTNEITTGKKYGKNGQWIGIGKSGCACGNARASSCDWNDLIDILYAVSEGSDCS